MLSMVPSSTFSRSSAMALRGAISPQRSSHFPLPAGVSGSRRARMSSSERRGVSPRRAMMELPRNLWMARV